MKKVENENKMLNGRKYGCCRTVSETQKLVVLEDFPITHAGIKPVRHQRLNVMIDGQPAIRYMRFMRTVRVERLELGRVFFSRWEPSVPTHPAHIIISTLDTLNNRWKTVRDLEIPSDPRILGKDLSQDMPTADITRYFEAIQREAPIVIEIGGLETDHLRVECDREYPVWPNHGQCGCGGIHCVPFRILDSLKAYGYELGQVPEVSSYNPLLRLTGCSPSAPKGMRVQNRPDMLLFAGKKLSVGFSLKRPVLTHLGFDELGLGMACQNRLLFSHLSRSWKNGVSISLSGPLLRTLRLDYGEQLWTGEVCVKGNRVIYRDLHCVEGLVIDAVFIVEPDGLIVELTQKCTKTLPYIEAEVWRLAWNIQAGITGCFGKPTCRPGRNGDVELPAMWATDAVGCLSCKAIGGDVEMTRLQVESYRVDDCVTGGIVLGERMNPEQCQIIPRGKITCTLDMRVTNILPDRAKFGSSKTPAGIRRSWATIFAGYRPETRMYSIHSVSTDGGGMPWQMELVSVTKRHPDGPDPLELARIMLERHIMDGPTYGYHRNLYLQTDPCIISAVGRVYQVCPDSAWLKKIESGLVETVQRMLGNMGDVGFLLSNLSGNSGSYRWSSHEVDIWGSGHIDALVNAWAYRAYKNAIVLMRELGRDDFSNECRKAAANIKANFGRTLINPRTGWVAGWKSRDGKLHDYGFLHINGPAIAFGLLDSKDARIALGNLEKLRREVGLDNACMGLPFNLIPFDRLDHMMPKTRTKILPTFEIYTDGALNGWTPIYYVRALSTYGFKEEARKIAEELNEGYALGMFCGGNGTGVEWKTWSGCPTGYEGTSTHCYTSIYSVAIEFGLAVPKEPEWWLPE